MKSFSFLRKLAPALVLATAALLPQPAVAGDKTITISQVIDLSGPNGSTGRDYVAGITTYFDTLNVQGGLNGRRIQYQVQDDKGDPQLAAKLAGEAAEKSDYMLGGIGLESTGAILANPQFKQSGHVLFAPLASPGKDAGNNRAFYWRPAQEQEIDYIFAWFEKLGIRKVGIAYQDAQLNKSLMQYVQQAVAKRGLSLVGSARIMRNPLETEKEAQKLAQAEPNIVISLADSISTGLFLREFRKHAERTFVAGTSLINLPTLSEIAGVKATEWTVFSQVVPNPSATSSLLQNEHLTMMRKFRDEEVSSMTLEGFAVAKSLIKAINLSRGNLSALLAHKGNIDIGGMTIVPPGNNGSNLCMSSFVDIALLRKGRSLMF